MENNCEHFATWMRYGNKICKQVEDVQEIVNGGLAAASIIGAGASLGVTLAASFLGSLLEEGNELTWKPKVIPPPCAPRPSSVRSQSRRGSRATALVLEAPALTWSQDATRP